MIFKLIIENFFRESKKQPPTVLPEVASCLSHPTHKPPISAADSSPTPQAHSPLNFSLSVGLQAGTSPLALPLGELSAKLTERAVGTMNRNPLP